MDPDTKDHITFAPNLSTRRGTAATIEETRTLATAHDGDDYFEEGCDLDPALTNKMTRSRTIEEADFHHTFKKQDVIDAENEPRRHNVVFISMMMCFMVAAFIFNGMRGTTYLAEGDGDEVAEPEEKLERRGGGDGLRLRCATTSIGGTAGSATGFGTGTGISTLPTTSLSIYPRASSAGTGTVSTGSMSTAPTGTAPAGSSAPCSKEGNFLCNGPQFFGICSHGTVIWQHVAEGTECQGGTIVGTGSYAQPTAKTPIRRNEVRSYSNITTTMPISAGAPNVAGPTAAATSSVCSAPDGMLVCNGPKLQGRCNKGSVIWQPVADGTECQNGPVVGTGIYGQPTVPHGRHEARSWSNTTTAAVPAGTSTDTALTPAISSSACTASRGMLICNGPDSFGRCNNGTVVWQPVDEGTECWDGRIVEVGSQDAVTTSPLNSTSLHVF